MLPPIKSIIALLKLFSIFLVFSFFINLAFKLKQSPPRRYYKVFNAKTAKPHSNQTKHSPKRKAVDFANTDDKRNKATVALKCVTIPRKKLKDIEKINR